MRMEYSTHGSPPIDPDDQNPLPLYVPPSNTIGRPLLGSQSAGGSWYVFAPPAGGSSFVLRWTLPSLSNVSTGKYFGTPKLIVWKPTMFHVIFCPTFAVIRRGTNSLIECQYLMNTFGSTSPAKFPFTRT